MNGHCTAFPGDSKFISIICELPGDPGGGSGYVGYIATADGLFVFFTEA